MSAPREPHPDGGQESSLRYELRNALGMSPFDRDYRLIEEVKRLKKLETREYKAGSDRGSLTPTK